MYLSNLRSVTFFSNLPEFEPSASIHNHRAPWGETYSSSISPGVRRATSGRINQAITTATKPVPAKLPSTSISIPFLLHRRLYRRVCTHKKPVLTPHGGLPWLIISGVQKLNMMAMRLEKASDQAAVRARRRCVGISAA